MLTKSPLRVRRQAKRHVALFILRRVDRARPGVFAMLLARVASRLSIHSNSLVPGFFNLPTDRDRAKRIFAELTFSQPRVNVTNSTLI